jgi:alanyl-tRNA synthetase
MLAGVEVVDVLMRENGDTVLHLLDAPFTGQPAEIVGEIDWDRRFDHMQQHTGQHILSQAFIQIACAQTVSFHLGAESVTIDLIGPRPLSSSEMEETESLANKIVWDNRPVMARIVNPTELAKLPLRKPPTVTEDVRLVQVADFDWSACGGTHVARTGEIGLIKIIKWEKRGAETRVEFRCGQRALIDYDQKNCMINRVAAGFNVGHWELDKAVERLNDEAKELRSRLRLAGRALAKHEADVLRASAPNVGGVRLVVYNLTQESLVDMRELARHLVSKPGVVALLGVGDLKAQFCFARSSDIEIDMVSLVRSTAEALGSRGGGGRPDFAQGGGPLRAGQQLETVLEQAARELRGLLERAD